MIILAKTTEATIREPKGKGFVSIFCLKVHTFLCWGKQSGLNWNELPLKLHANARNANYQNGPVTLLCAGWTNLFCGKQTTVTGYPLENTKQSL